MAHDAQLSSLSEYDQSLERQVSDLQAILHHLLASISDTRAEVDANRARIDLCLANSAAASARAELAINNAQEAVPIAREAALEELLKIAQAANDDGPQHAKPKRKCRKLPPGWAGLITGVTVALGLLKAHKAAAAAGAGALMMAASAPMAQSLLPDTDAHLPAVVSHHHVRGHRDLDPVTGAILPPRRRNGGTAKSVHRRRAPSPKATAPTGATTPPPSPVPSPTGSTIPQPSPAATPPVPSATPTATGVLMAPAWDH